MKTIIAALLVSLCVNAARADEQPSFAWRQGTADREALDSYRSLTMAGGIIFGGTYVANIAVAKESGEWRFAVPVFGPFMALAQTHGTNPILAFAGIGAVLDGVIQTGGLAMMIAGAVKYSAKKSSLRRIAFAPSGLGLMAAGQF